MVGLDQFVVWFGFSLWFCFVLFGVFGLVIVWFGVRFGDGLVWFGVWFGDGLVWYSIELRRFMSLGRQLNCDTLPATNMEGRGRFKKKFLKRTFAVFFFFFYLFFLSSFNITIFLVRVADFLHLPEYVPGSFIQFQRKFLVNFSQATVAFSKVKYIQIVK